MATITRLGNFFDRTNQTQRRIFQYTGPSSYTTGGESVTPEVLGLGKVFVLLAGNGAWNSVAAAMRLLVYDVTNKKVLWFVPNTGAEVANGTDLSGYTTNLEAIGQ